jgi:mannose/fructose/N-acetylgalactosamine-specific phosphotransferase system component IIC
VLFVVLGFAILHRVFAARPNQRFWLAGIYVLTLFVPQMLVPMALLGISDLWMDWRRRWLPR